MWVKVRDTKREPTTERAPARPDVWAGRGIEIESAPLDSLDDVPTGERAPAPEARPRDVERTPALERACVTNCAREVTGDVAQAPTRTPDESPVVPTSRSLAAQAPRARPAKPAASTVPSASRASSAADGATDGGAAPGAAFGSAGMPPGVRHLPQAYTRAISQGSWGVVGFRSAPAGALCDVRLSISVGDDRSVGPVEYDERERDAVPALCRALLENARRLIASGEFSLDASSLASGVLRLRVLVEISDGEPRTESEDSPHGLWSESHEPPSVRRRGRSTFTLNSGRRVDAFVELE
jgi:hypothetical protein